MPTPERPVLAGPWKFIGPKPELSRHLPGDATHRLAFERGRLREHNAAVDHRIARDDAAPASYADSTFYVESA